MIENKHWLVCSCCCSGLGSAEYRNFPISCNDGIDLTSACIFVFLHELLCSWSEFIISPQAWNWPYCLQPELSLDTELQQAASLNSIWEKKSLKVWGGSRKNKLHNLYMNWNEDWNPVDESQSFVSLHKNRSTWRLVKLNKTLQICYFWVFSSSEGVWFV